MVAGGAEIASLIVRVFKPLPCFMRGVVATDFSFSSVFLCERSLIAASANSFCFIVRVFEPSFAFMSRVITANLHYNGLSRWIIIDCHDLVWMESLKKLGQWKYCQQHDMD